MITEKKIIELEELSIKSENNNEKSLYFVAASILIGAILVAASVIFSAGYLVKNLTSNVITATGSAPAAPTTGTPPAAGSPVKVVIRTDAPSLGKSDAKVTIVEFADFQCPFCKQYYQKTFNEIKTKYIDTGKVKYVFMHFPLTQIHVNAQISGVASECANQQGKFWEYHDILYTQGQSNGDGLDKASLEKYADQLALNKGTLGFGKNKFNQCLESNATLKTVQADQAEGSKDGITGTPSFFINGKPLVGAQPAANFEKIIEDALK
jgi:protein-disulfide isomerase